MKNDVCQMCVESVLAYRKILHKKGLKDDISVTQELDLDIELQDARANVANELNLMKNNTLNKDDCSSESSTNSHSELDSEEE